MKIKRQIKPFLLVGLTTCGMAYAGSAQTLMHRYSFDTDASDSVGSADGTLMGTAAVAGGELVLPGGAAGSGHYLDLPAATIAINTYGALTLELWSLQDTVDQGFSGTAAFGAHAGGIGQDYVMVSTTRGDNVSRGMISTLDGTTEPWNDETGMNGAELNDDVLHHYLLTISDTHLSFYVDGVRGAEPIALAAHNTLSSVATDIAYLGRGAYNNDGLWRGSIDDFRIWEGDFSDAQAASSFALGPNQVIPEPSTYALIIGLGALGVMLIRRRKQ